MKFLELKHGLTMTAYADLENMAGCVAAHDLRCESVVSISIVLFDIEAISRIFVVVVTISLKTRLKLGIPNVMLTLLGTSSAFVVATKSRMSDSWKSQVW